MPHFPLENFKIMTSSNHHYHSSRVSKQKFLATIGLSELEREVRNSELKNIKNDDDVWLLKMIKALTDSEKDHDC